MARDRAVAEMPEREREVLRLLLRGYDIKSIARELDLSVHVVNERLRDARRRLGASSSRQAARMLAGREGPNFPGNKEFGLGRKAVSDVTGNRLDDERRSLSLPIAGAVMIIIAAALGMGAYADRRSSLPPQPGVPPRIIATNPGRGAVLRPGPFLLSATYDQPMLDGSFSYTQSSPDTAIECAFPPRLSRDRRTFTVRCTARPGRHYETWLNRPPYLNFKGMNGIAAEPYPLAFRAADR